MDILAQHISDLLPSAAALAVVAYFTRFFGKVIADQNPFSDDRDWHIEMSGVMFMLILTQGIVGVAAAVYGPHLYTHIWMHWIDLIIVGLGCGFFAFVNAALSAKFFNLGKGAFDSFEDKNTWFNFFYKAGKRLPLSVPTIVLAYVATNEYLSGNIVWIMLILPIVLYLLILMALAYSYKRMEDRVGVDVYFTDTTAAPLKSVAILKVNSDNIRLRSGDTIMIFNKSEILKMEMKVPEKYRSLIERDQ